ncbi:TagK domain-containing protein [Burkholderia pseudomallei]|uniref:TagK domain-containing protein n=1 Tax=Burkholderia pseudomallei TaxID=28450 RepID=UPI0011786D48|nr:TagK domain-containing protein [Burkholderia pseudomallei]
MWITNLFKHRKSTTTRAEPIDIRDLDLPTDNLESLDSQGFLYRQQSQDTLNDNDATLSLIGTPISIGDGKLRNAGVEDVFEASNVIETLHKWYGRALSDPHMLLTSDWTARVLPPREQHARGVGQSDNGCEHSSRIESIEMPLSVANLMDYFFGSLEKSEELELAQMEPVEEILLLFASIEYRAVTSRKLSSFPPTLAQRDYHSLSIDTPLSIPNSVCGHETP